MAAALRHGDGAEKEQERAGAKQRVLRGIRRQRRRVLAIHQHGFADADLVAGLEPVFADAHSIDEGPHAGVSIDDVVAAIARAHDAVLPGRVRLGKPDVRGGGAADAGFARPQRKPLPEKRSADDDELRLHGLVGDSLAGREGMLVNRSVHRREPIGSQMAEIARRRNGFSTVYERRRRGTPVATYTVHIGDAAANPKEGKTMKKLTTRLMIATAALVVVAGAASAQTMTGPDSVRVPRGEPGHGAGNIPGRPPGDADWHTDLPAPERELRPVDSAVAAGSG